MDVRSVYLNGYRFLLTRAIGALLICGPVLAEAQSPSHPVLDASGFQQHRDYFSELSFEHIDMLTGNREFDAVSRQYVAQTFSGTSALLKPHNFLGPGRREQIRATLEAAKATGRTALFEFRSEVHSDVMDFIRRNAERIGANFDIYR